MTQAQKSDTDLTIPDADLGNSQVLSRLMMRGVVELDKVFNDFRSDLKAMIFARLDRRLLARVDASDIVQETYIRAMASLTKYLESPEVHPVIWLRLIGKHLVAETHRLHFRAKRTPNQEVDAFDVDRDHLVDNMADSIISVHSLLAREEILNKVRGLMSELSPLDREVLEMRHSDGMSIVRIAESLEIPVETAKKRYYRALERFRKVAQSTIEDS